LGIPFEIRFRIWGNCDRVSLGIVNALSLQGSCSSQFSARVLPG
jgi:hypothetical protein